MQAVAIRLTGERITDAQPGFDGQTGEPAVHITLDGQGSRIFQQVTRENVNKRMAILLIEKGKVETSSKQLQEDLIRGKQTIVNILNLVQDTGNDKLITEAYALME